jgi:hypothetical protein
MSTTKAAGLKEKRKLPIIAANWRTDHERAVNSVGWTAFLPPDPSAEVFRTIAPNRSAQTVAVQVLAFGEMFFRAKTSRFFIELISRPRRCASEPQRTVARVG